MLKAGDLACREDHRVRGVKIGKTRRDQGISHVHSVAIIKFPNQLSKNVKKYDLKQLSFLTSQGYNRFRLFWKYAEIGYFGSLKLSGLPHFFLKKAYDF